MKIYDVVIIGGGIIGASVAYYLSKEDMNVALVERGDIASGTSSRCDGDILIADKKPGFDTEMAYASLELFKRLNYELPYNFDYVQKGSLYLIENEEEMDIARDYVKKQALDGYPFRMLDRKEIHDEEPYVAEDVIGGMEIGCDGSINPMTLTFSLVLEAKKNGADIFSFSSVKGIKLNRRGAVEEVITDKEAIKTERVVNCAGVWAPVIGKMVGIDVPIIPRQGQLLVAEKTFQVGRRPIVEFGYIVTKFGDKSYKRDVSPELEAMGIALVFEPTLANNFVIGSSRAFVGYNTDVSIEVIQGIAERAIRFFPVLKDILIIRAYAGLRPWVPDHFPIISEVEKVPGFYIAAGHEGDGIGLSQITGKLITQMIAGEETVIPIERLSFSRFEKS